MTQLFRVLYCSRNTMAGPAETVQAEIEAILATSRANNARDQVTGGLLYSANCFAQVLEGPYEAVQDAFERIQCDDRHGEVTVLQAGPVETRDFAAWAMAFAGRQGDDPALGATLAKAFAGQSAAGDAILATLRGVVAGEAVRAA